MAKNRVTTHLGCQVCKNKNYTQTLAKKRVNGSLSLSKFCARCRKHTSHNETK